jgi:hypothetical protein
MNTMLFSMVIAVVLSASVAEPTVELGSAANYVILAKAGISTVSPSTINGSIAVSPIAGTAMTGFTFSLDSSSQFSTSSQIVGDGKAYAADFIAPTPSKLTTAVGAMMTAYTDAAGRPNSNGARINLGTGLLGGALPGGPHAQLTAGVYTFTTGINIGGNLHFHGTCSIACILQLFCTNILTSLTHKNTPVFISPLSAGAGVYIIQVAGTLVMAGNYTVILEDGALPENIFWQVTEAVNIGAKAHMEGTILTATAVTFITESTLNGRIYAQTAVTLQKATITCPTEAGSCSQ